MGPVCKHVVAALFYLQRNILDIVELPARGTSKKQVGKSVSGQEEELLDILSHDALKSFVHNTCIANSKFRQLFVAKHIHLLYPESKDLYKKQLQALTKTYSDKHGFVGYQDAKRLGGIVNEMAGEAMTGLAKGEIQKSMFISLAIIEEMADLVNCNADDSDGQIGSSIEEAFCILDALAESDLNTTQHDELFNCLLALFGKDVLKVEIGTLIR